MRLLFRKGVDKAPTMLGSAILAIAIAGLLITPFGLTLSLTHEVLIAVAAMTAASRFA